MSTMWLHRLSAEPSIFTPIEFHGGINLILGELSEKDDQGKKVNGVGKSMCIEFLHFALCRNYYETRVSRIPKEALPADLVVILDVSIGPHVIQIRRSLSAHTQPVIRSAGHEDILFESLQDATDYLGALLFDGTDPGVSFRKVLSVLMRDEESGFKSCVNPYRTDLKIPDDISPHLYLMGIDFSPYSRLRDAIEQLSTQTKMLGDLKRTVTRNGELKIGDIPSLLNEEKQASAYINQALQSLRAEPAFAQLEETLNTIEGRLHELRSERKKLSFQIDQIKVVPLEERIDTTDVRILYQRIKSGLGDLVEKSLQQALRFKLEIEQFQQTLRREELVVLEDRRQAVNKDIQRLADEHSTLMKSLDKQGSLKEIRSGLEIAVNRTSEYQRLATQYKLYQDKARDIDLLKSEKAIAFQAVSDMIREHEAVEHSIDRIVVELYERIMASSHASFRFVLSASATNKRPLSFVVRGQDDGSHSIDRVLVFIYDFSLMINEHSAVNHPGLLVHDNILEVDQDTLVKCLNTAIALWEEGREFQYILTLNRDSILTEEQTKNLELDVEAAKCASFTKANQFLGFRYQEVKRKGEIVEDE